ncbi:hypothetical protein Hypma_006985 [Hypsizygus marmoreus]|uniref:Uncharacterized protein n=1 Tax=Hypsizygus marmoreus TaxID=39966 RepID=A0A369KCH6_HYPMA|nr:hypothetical protein Hypma_006985 [Hypsizygus marmoreus]
MAAALYMFQTVSFAVMLYASQWYWKQPYHTSALSGAEWVKELIWGHPDRIRTELGMRVHVFLALVAELRRCGLSDSRYLSLEEQTAIFLYTCVTGLSIRHVGERFQHANETISTYFCLILTALASPPFYTKYVRLLAADDSVPSSILNNPKFFPFFGGALGAMDGTHINSSPSASERHAALHAQWEGSAADAMLFHDARTSDLPIPDGKYYLADAGFGACDTLLVPYRGVRYHLAEWGRAAVRPQNREELYNLRHASARNVVECIFGALKQRFGILNHAPQYDLDIQALIPPALAATHNFILDHDTDEAANIPDIPDPTPGFTPNCNCNFGTLARGVPTAAEKERARVKRDQIAQAMWESYQALLQANNAEQGLE